MNIKFRMPRFGKNIKRQPMLREIAMTVIATTISIILTFGSASVIEKRQKANNRRQTVMMIIHDIEENVKQLKKWKESEESYIKMAQYIQAHIDGIDSISTDTLEDVYDYLIEGESFVLKIDDSKEKLFQENQALWNGLEDNMKIIDVIHTFFAERRSQLEEIRTDCDWQRPISQQEKMSILLEGYKSGYPIELAQILKEQLESSKVKYFLDHSYVRQREYDRFIFKLNVLADQLKFLLNISDDEMHSFIENHEQFQIATRRNLIGKWSETDSTIINFQFNFQSDGALITRNVYKYVAPYVSGYIPYTFYDRGKWEFKGDTIFCTYYVDQLSVTQDLSNVLNRDEIEQSYRSLVNEKELMKQRYIFEFYNNHKVRHDSMIVRISASGDIAEFDLLDDDETVYFEKLK